MEFFLTRRRLVGFPANESSYIASVRVAAGQHEYRKLTAETWASKVFAQARAKEVLIFVHGYNTSHAEFMARFRRIRRGCRKAGFKGEVLGFEWPSHDQLAAYRKDRDEARKAAPFLVDDCIRVLAKAEPTAKINIMGHSMGCYLCANALVDRPLAEGALNEILFVASDVARTKMRAGEDFADAIDRPSRRVTNYRSMRDQVLDLSEKIFNGGRKRAGKDGVESTAHADTHNVSCSRRFFTFVPPRERTTDKTHNFYFDDPRFFEDCALTLASRPEGGMSTRGRRPNGELELKP